nr:PREDICTED: protein tyrosine phosphatase domain-containing protein 1-like isoform X1 [Bemisia tabaci]
MSPAKAGMVKERRTSLAAVTSVAQSLQGITIEANYSAFSESVRRRAPKGVQCAVFCGGRRCKYENPEVWDSTHKAIRGIYSHWVTDEILAMARPCTEIIVKRNLIKQFQSSIGIRSIVNLQKVGEHGSCGCPLEKAGFTYDPSIFMKNKIYFYNYEWEDYGVMESSSLLDMVKVLSFALTEGKVAIHCHAGLGRTGVLIACYLVYAVRLKANDAIRFVRLKRPQSIQTRGQIQSVQEFEQYILPNSIIFSKNGPTRSSSTPDFSLPQYVLLQKMMLHGQESRCLHHIPKIVLMICERLLMLCSCKPVSLILIRNSGFVAIPVLRTFLASESVQPKLKVSFPESQSAGTLHETSKNAMEVVEEVPEEEEVDEKETSTEKKGEEKKISTFLRNSEEEYKYAGEPNQECIDKTVEAFLRDLSSVREEIRKKVLQFRMQLNHEDGSWRKIQRETDFQVLASLLLEWLEHLRSPVLTQDHIVNIIIQKDSAAAFKSFPLSCQYTLEYLLRFVNHLTIAKHDLSEDLVKRIIAAATHQAVNVRGQYLPSGKSFNNLRKGTFSRLLEFINEMMVVTANREASTPEK